MAPLPLDTVGGRIHHLRTEAGMSLSELADATGVSKSYLWNLESKEQHQRPSGETLYAIAKALNTTMSALMGKRLLTEPQDDVDDALRAFAKRAKLSKAEITMLASIKWRGDEPRTVERWRFVYDALKASRSLDS